MIDKLKALYIKYREQVTYIFFGGLTTLVNIIAYYIFNHVMSMSVTASTALAQVLAVLFAYVTNKLFVFKSVTDTPKALLKEMGSFFACRAISFFLDIGIMKLTVDILGWPDMVMKIVSNVIIVIVNYVASKLFIFNRARGAGDADK